MSIVPSYLTGWKGPLERRGTNTYNKHAKYNDKLPVCMYLMVAAVETFGGLHGEARGLQENCRYDLGTQQHAMASGTQQPFLHETGLMNSNANAKKMQTVNQVEF
jgi:hypothetical protein